MKRSWIPLILIAPVALTVCGCGGEKGACVRNEGMIIATCGDDFTSGQCDMMGGRFHEGDNCSDLGYEPNSPGGIHAAAAALVDLVEAESDGSGSGRVAPVVVTGRVRIRYPVLSSGIVRLEIRDLAGRTRQTVTRATGSDSRAILEWDRGDLPAGLYSGTLRTGSVVRRLALLLEG